LHAAYAPVKPNARAPPTARPGRTPQQKKTAQKRIRGIFSFRIFSRSSATAATLPTGKHFNPVLPSSVYNNNILYYYYYYYRYYCFCYSSNATIYSSSPYILYLMSGGKQYHKLLRTTEPISEHLKKIASIKRCG